MNQDHWDNQGSSHGQCCLPAACKHQLLLGACILKVEQDVYQVDVEQKHEEAVRIPAPILFALALAKLPDLVQEEDH